jgi:membrane-associated protease RseP (regulator of RpoE activity)
MTFVLLILVIGGLLAAIFGRGYAQLFLFGTASLISWAILAFALFIVVGLVWAHFASPPVYTPTPQADQTINTYVPPGSGLTDTTPAPAPAAPTNVAPATTDSAPAPVQSTGRYNIPNPATGIGSSEGPSIGITQEVATDRESRWANVPEGYGIILKSIWRGGPADVAGMQVNDVIVAVDGQRMASSQLRRYENSLPPGRSITFFVYRWANGQTRRGPITVTPV